MPRTDAPVRLFCFPYAGGGTSIFHSWPNRLPPIVEVCSIQLPGRGRRLWEEPFNQLPALVRALARELSDYLDRPFAFFGHSMGALIAFELARRLRRERELGPAHLFVSGARAPRQPNRERPIHELPEREFIRALRGFNGTPKELLESDELMQLVLPALRADFAICDTYTYTREPELNCPISAFGGLHDPKLSREDLKAWKAETTGPFSVRMLPGDHFFLHTAEKRLLSLLSDELDKLVRRVT